MRSEEHTSELQSPCNLVCRLLLEKKNKQTTTAWSLAQSSIDKHRASQPTEHPSRPYASRSIWRNSFTCGWFELSIFFFFNDTATTEIYTLSLHDALPF